MLSGNMTTCVQAAHTRSNVKKTLDGSSALFHRKSFYLQSFIIKQTKTLSLLLSLGSNVAASTSGSRVKNQLVYTLHLRHDTKSATSTCTLWDSGYSHGRYSSSHGFAPPKTAPSHKATKFEAALKERLPGCLRLRLPDAPALMQTNISHRSHEASKPRK